MQNRFLTPLLLVTVGAVSSLSISISFAAVKDQSRIPPPSSKLSVSPQKGNTTPGNLFENGEIPILEQRPSNPPEGPEGTEPPADAEEFSVEDIPAIERVELTLDLAKRAIDAFAQAGKKYDDKGLNDYPTLKEFVEKTDAGKELQKEVQSHGFKDIVEWNTAIMNVNFAYGALIEDPTHEIQDQISEVRESKTITDEKKLRIIASLNALIPSKANIKIIRELNELPDYRKKLNLLNPTE